MFLREIGNGRGGEHTGVFDGGACLPKAGDERGGNPWTGFAGVHAKNHANRDVFAFHAQAFCERPADGEDGSWIEWGGAGDGANAIGAKQLAHVSLVLRSLSRF